MLFAENTVKNPMNHFSKALNIVKKYTRFFKIGSINKLLREFRYARKTLFCYAMLILSKGSYHKSIRHTPPLPTWPY